jgi:uncharacterized membrane protein YczE
MKLKTKSKQKSPYIEIIISYMKRIVLYAIGGAFIALGVTFALRANLGLSTWDTLHYAIHSLFGITVGTATIVVAAAFTIAVIILNNNFKYLIMAIPIVYVGVLIDVINLNLLKDFEVHLLWQQIIVYISALLLLPFGGSLLIISRFPAGVFDEFTLTMMRVLKSNNLIKVRGIIEISAVTAAFIIGLIAGIGLGQIMVGTIVFALLVGTILHQYLHFFERIGWYEIEQND